MGEEDFEGWSLLTQRLGKKIMLVGDDLFVTDHTRFEDGIEMGLGNAILIKPNQVGTLSETLKTIKMAKENGYNFILCIIIQSFLIFVNNQLPKIFLFFIKNKKSVLRGLPCQRIFLYS